MGIWRLLVALKYQFYKNIWGGGAVQSSRAGAKKFRIPWFKVGLVGVAIFFFTQKDIQFSINMKAPLGGEEYGASQTSQGGDHQQMNVAQAISFREKGKKDKKTEAALNLNEQRVDEYISRFRKVALMEMKKFGIPASVKMAWGLLESEAGQKPERLQDNNHFGPLMAGQPFTTAWENWRAHSLLLQTNYSGLLSIGNNYRKWIKALDEARVSTDRDFDQKLLFIIDQYQLHLLDREILQ